MKLYTLSILTLILTTSVSAQPVARLARLIPVTQRLHTRRLLSTKADCKTSSLEERIKTLEDEIARLKKENTDNQQRLTILKEELLREMRLLELGFNNKIMRHR